MQRLNVYTSLHNGAVIVPYLSSQKVKFILVMCDIHNMNTYRDINDGNMMI